MSALALASGPFSRAAPKPAEPESPLFSAYWYKIGDLTPRLRPGVTLTRRVEQGEVWYILSAPETNRHFRLDAGSHAIVAALDGQHRLDDIWRDVLERFGDAAPGQDETLRLLGQLHQADALHARAAPALGEFGRRARKTQRQKLTQQFKNPLFFKLPLFDPDPLLNATLPFVRPLFTLWGFLAWGLISLWLGVQAAQNWERLSATILDRALAFDNLLIAALVFPLAKALHELAHGWAVKVWGGEVRETGIMFLVFLPAPYVEASAAAAFPRRRQRILVSAAGMMAEALLAAVAMWVWLGAETGFVSALAFNMLLIAGVSTFLFNGNPLLRFDAYFILSDLIGIQNLAGRSGKWWGWLVHRFGFGLAQWPNPARTGSEARWFAFYHPASYAYRVFLTLSIALFVATSYPVIGLALGAWSVTTTFAIPAATALWQVATGPRVAAKRGRTLGVTALLAGLPLAALFVLPVPHGTLAPGVIVAPDQAWLTAPVEAEILTVQAPPGQGVRAGEAVAAMGDPLLAAEAQVYGARVTAAEARLLAEEAREEGAGQAAATRAELGYLREEAARRDADLGATRLEAPRAGQLLALPDMLIPGRRFPKGAQIGMVVAPGMAAQARVLVPADRIEDLRLRPGAVRLEIEGQGFAPIPARLARVAPEPSREMPYPALTASAGGPLTMDPSDPEGRRAAQAFHLAEITTDLPLSEMAVGARVWARFDHGPSPLAPRLWRQIRQTFLARLAL